MKKSLIKKRIRPAIKSYDIFDKKDAGKLGEKLWDEIIKSVSKRSPDQLIPVVNEIFRQNYPVDSTVSFLSTEYPALLKKKHTSIFNDITFQINHDKIYHIEFQMTNESDIIIRMIEYNFSIALQHSVDIAKDSGTLRIQFPRSAVIYPSTGCNLPATLQCQLIFPDGNSYDYDIPTIKIQDYTLDELHEKHLNLFLPYTLLRFRPRLDSIHNPLTKSELTEFVNTIILNLENAEKEHHITNAQHRDYLYLLDRAADRIFARHTEFRKEVNNMTECKLVLPSERMEIIINSFNKKIDKLASTVKKKEAILQEKEAAIKEMDSAIKEKDSAIKEMDSAIKEKDSRIEELERLLAERK